MDSNSKKGGYNGLFWALGASAVAALIGSAYYIYTLVNPEEELTEKDIENINVIKQTLNQSQEEGGHQGGLNVEGAIQIMAMTNRLSEDYIKSIRPDLEERRRKAIKDPEEYEKLVLEGLELKEAAYNQTMKKVFTQFPEYTMEDIQKLLSTVPPQEIEKLNMKYDVPVFEGEKKPSKQKVKESYIFYGKKFQNEMKEFYRMMATANHGDPSQEQYFFLRMLVMKMKVDDELFLLSGYTEPQIKYLLFEYELNLDPEVKMINEQLMKFDQMFNPQMEQ